MPERSFITIEDIERVHRLFTTRHALSILDGLRRGLEPAAAVPDRTGPRKIRKALAVLAEWQLVNVEPAIDAPAESRLVTLTPKGARFATLLDDLCHDRDSE